MRSSKLTCGMGTGVGIRSSFSSGNALKTCLQEPQRTFPLACPRIAAVILKFLLQEGQVTYTLSLTLFSI